MRSADLERWGDVYRGVVGDSDSLGIGDSRRVVDAQDGGEVSRKPNKAGSYQKFACPLCSKVVKRHVSRGVRTVVSWCAEMGKTVLLEKVSPS